MYTFLILFFLLSIVFSFLCSIWEAVLLSVTPSFAQRLVQEGSPTGSTLQHFKENIDRPLAAILTLNTIAHTVGAIGVGAQAAAIWGTSLVSTVVVPVGMTLAILLLSEIIPKTIGASHWQRLAGFTVRSVKLVTLVLTPLVYISQLITSSLKKDKDTPVLSRADLGAMAELSEREGVIGESEGNILRNLLRFHSVLAEHVMTPRTVVVAADESTSIRAFHDDHLDIRFSRILVYASELDQLTGYVLKDDILRRIVDGDGDKPLAEIRRDVTAVSESFPIPELFHHFIETREHLAAVVDEFGGLAGIVTMEDVIETLLGMEIVDEQDGTVDMQALAREQWKLRARRVGLLEPGEAIGLPKAYG